MKKYYNSFLTIFYIVLVFGIIGIFYKIESLLNDMKGVKELMPSQIILLKHWIWFLFGMIAAITTVFSIYLVAKTGKVKQRYISGREEEYKKKIGFLEEKLLSTKNSFLLLQKALDDLIKIEENFYTHSDVMNEEVLKSHLRELREIKVKEYYYDLQRDFNNIDEIKGLVERFPDFVEEFEYNLLEDSKNIALMQEKIKDINKVVEVIRKIATETRLIAFNAAIESSRSKEESRGFNVVVSQIRNLVDEIEEATTDIQETMKEFEVLSSKSVLMSEILLKKIKEKKKLTLRIKGLLELLSSFPPIFEELMEDINLYNDRCKKSRERLESLLKGVKREKIEKEDLIKKRNEIIENINIILNNIKDSISNS